MNGRGLRAEVRATIINLNKSVDRFVVRNRLIICLIKIFSLTNWVRYNRFTVL